MFNWAFSSLKYLWHGWLNLWFTKLSARNLEESSRYYNKGWIPCKERLPERGVLVLTCDRNGWISVNVNNSYGSIKNDFECGYYEAWMPLPEPYKEKQTWKQ